MQIPKLGNKQNEAEDRCSKNQTEQKQQDYM